MADIDLLFKRRATATIAYGEDDGQKFDIAIEFRPEIYDARLHNSIVERGKDATFDELTSALDKLLISWDLSHGGEPWPMNPENLRRLPIPLLFEMLIGIQRTIMARGNETGSKDTSSQESETPPSTTSSFEPLD